MLLIEVDLMFLGMGFLIFLVFIVFLAFLVVLAFLVLIDHLVYFIYVERRLLVDIVVEPVGI